MYLLSETRITNDFKFNFACLIKTCTIHRTYINIIITLKINEIFYTFTSTLIGEEPQKSDHSIKILGTEVIAMKNLGQKKKIIGRQKNCLKGGKEECGTNL